MRDLQPQHVAAQDLRAKLLFVELEEQPARISNDAANCPEPTVVTQIELGHGSKDAETTSRLSRVRRP